LTNKQMQLIGFAAAGVIQEETQDGIDQNGKRFKPYSKGYAEFRKEEGRSNKVDLTFTGHMLNSMKVIRATDSTVTIGFIDSTPARGGLRPSQKMERTNKVRPWFGFGRKGSKRRDRISQIGSEIFIEALTRQS
jgi:hypothetical protein